MQITDRDMDIFITLDKVGYMSSKQMCREFFKSYTHGMKRLKMLVDNDYLKASPLLYQGNMVYWLYKKGLDFVYDNSTDRIKRTINPLIPHYLSCGEFYFKVKRKYEIEEFNTELDLDFTHDNKTINFRPDIYTRFNNSNFLVEIDNMEQKYLIAKKIKVYEAFGNTKAYKQHFELYPKILIVSNAAERFKTKIEEVKTNKLNYYLTEFTKLENIDKDVWLKTGKKERCRLWE